MNAIFYNSLNGTSHSSSARPCPSWNTIWATRHLRTSRRLQHLIHHRYHGWHPKPWTPCSLEGWHSGFYRAGHPIRLRLWLFTKPEKKKLVALHEDSERKVATEKGRSVMLRSGLSSYRLWPWYPKSTWVYSLTSITKAWICRARLLAWIIKEQSRSGWLVKMHQMHLAVRIQINTNKKYRIREIPWHLVGLELRLTKLRKQPITLTLRNKMKSEKL